MNEWSDDLSTLEGTLELMHDITDIIERLDKSGKLMDYAIDLLPVMQAIHKAYGKHRRNRPGKLISNGMLSTNAHKEI